MRDTLAGPLRRCRRFAQWKGISLEYEYRVTPTSQEQGTRKPRDSPTEYHNFLRRHRHTLTTLIRKVVMHPNEAFGAFKEVVVDTVVCEEKHMGSRAIVVICRDSAAAARRFTVNRPALGVIYTRTGRPFFSAPADEAAIIERVRSSVTMAGLWDELETDWLVLDCELLPWSAKAEELLRGQYAAVGAAATATLTAEKQVLATAASRGVDVGELVILNDARVEMVDGFVKAYRQYCWEVTTLEDLKIAPFQILAGEGETYALRDHLWHLEVLSRLVAADETTFRLTRHIVVDLSDESSIQRGAAWWQTLTDAGGEGMVVKPVDVARQGPKGLIQPGIKCPESRVSAHHLRPRVHGSWSDCAAVASASRDRSQSGNSHWASRL